jgi:hypothetical protein
VTDEARNIALGAGVALILLIASCELRATDSEYLKQILRLQATEFCATVGRPPQVIADALNKALEQDPKTWLPAVLWWNRIAEKYEKARCGDA